MSLHEIVLPETKPETEWVRGRAVQKVSATYWHATLHGLIFAALRDWADAGRYGRVGTERRFRVAPPGEVVRPLVPDVAYLSYAALQQTRRRNCSKSRSPRRPSLWRSSRPTIGRATARTRAIRISQRAARLRLWWIPRGRHDDSRARGQDHATLRRHARAFCTACFTLDVTTLFERARH
jgi:hypothetical protein